MDDRHAAAVHAVLDGDEVDGVLRATFFRSSTTDETPAPQRRRPPLRAARPDHYEVICISLYKEDLARLDAKVQELKRQGHRKMSRSALIRFALDSVDLSALPRGY